MPVGKADAIRRGTPMTMISRRVGLALALSLLGSVQARAVMITGYAGGEITLNRTTGRPGGSQLYNFTPGEGLYITYSFETSRVENPGGSGGAFGSYTPVPVFFQLYTSGGYTASSQSIEFRGGNLFVRNGATDSLVFRIGTGGLDLELSLFDPTGTVLSSTALPTQEQLTRFTQGSVEFNRERSAGDENFVASIRSLPSAIALPLPEPSTFAMGGIGLGIVGLGYFARRRRERASA